MVELTISAPQVEFLIVKAREFDVKEGATDPDEGSNGADDRMIDVLTDQGDDPVVSEIAGFVTALSDDEQVDLVALLRLGRAMRLRRMERPACRGGAELRPRIHDRYLLGQPMLADFLAEGLEELGLSDSRGERMTPVS